MQNGKGDSFRPVNRERGLSQTMKKSTGDVRSINRVARSVIETFRRRGWSGEDPPQSKEPE